MVNRRTITSTEVCKILGISKQKLYWMIKQRLIRPLGYQKNPFLFTPEEVERCLRDTMSPTYVKMEKEEVS